MDPETSYCVSLKTGSPARGKVADGSPAQESGASFIYLWTHFHESLWLRTYIWRSDGQHVCSAGNGFQASQGISESEGSSELSPGSCSVHAAPASRRALPRERPCSPKHGTGDPLDTLWHTLSDLLQMLQFMTSTTRLFSFLTFTSLLKCFAFGSQKHLSFHVLILKKHFFLGMNKPHHLVLYSVCFGSVQHFLLNEPFESAWSVQG